MRAGYGLAVLVLVLVGACDSGDHGKAVISVRDPKNAPAGTKPGFKVDLDLPASMQSGPNVEIDGVKLPPGSKVAGFALDALTSNDPGARVAIRFDSPMTAADTRRYFRTAFEKRGLPITDVDGALAGTSKDGDRFRLILADAADGHTSGRLTILARDKG